LFVESAETKPAGGLAFFLHERYEMDRRAVLVTGASSGIGRESVLLLAQHGFRVFAGVRKPEDGQALVQASEGSLTPVILDVTDAASIRSAAEAIRKSLRDDESFSLVNNAGIAVAAPLELLPVDDLRRQFDVNVFGQVAVTQAFLPLLRQHRGRIVFMGSLFGRIAPPLVAPYSAAKHAIEAIADALVVELWPWKISVSLLEPGNIATPIWDKSKPTIVATYGESAPETRELYKDTQGSMLRLADWFGKAGITPRKVARVVMKALCARRPRSRYLVGWDAKFFGTIVPRSPDRLRYWVMRRIIAPR
jgi:NAD(P)-dependent dehydrogenase (short-subunit alcohol dehydrogenase family)